VTPGRHPWWLGLAARGASVLLLALGRTWRIEHEALAARDNALAWGEGRCIFALWHARLLALIFTHRHRGAAVLVSRHRDGELIARVVEQLGYRTARGSSTRGGGEGARAMLSHAARGAPLAITPDGPRGPAETVKPGLVYLASRSGLPVVPVAAAASRAWVFRSWDRFRVPWPFARVVVAHGEPITVPPELDRAEAERWRARLQEALHALTAEVARRAGEPATSRPATGGRGSRAVEGA
jgi:lysophospholipid acyltransferase (LPLAT)-like uncharacterized protein